VLHLAKSFDVLSVSLMLTKLERLDFELFTKPFKLKVVYIIMFYLKEGK